MVPFSCPEHCHVWMGGKCLAPRQRGLVVSVTQVTSC